MQEALVDLLILKFGPIILALVLQVALEKVDIQLLLASMKEAPAVAAAGTAAVAPLHWQVLAVEALAILAEYQVVICLVVSAKVMVTPASLKHLLNKRSVTVTHKLLTDTVISVTLEKRISNGYNSSYNINLTRGFCVRFFYEKFGS